MISGIWAFIFNSVIKPCMRFLQGTDRRGSLDRE